jgi:hypothetical protein
MRREHASEVTRVNIFTHNGAPQALVGCHENSIGGVRAMRREHASEVTRVNIFTHNGAPQALVGCLGSSVG